MTDRQPTARSFAELLELADCEDETELTEVLTDRLDPRGVTGQVVLVEHDGDVWTLRVPGHWATLIEFPTTLAWVEEAAEDLLRETLQATDEAASQKAEEAVIEDRAVLEAASWRLASALLRRHPDRLRLIRAFPAGGQADCLWLLSRDGGAGDVRLNRHGTIQVVTRFDRLPVTGPELVCWADYLRTDHRDSVRTLEAQAGLPARRGRRPRPR